VRAYLDIETSFSGAISVIGIYRPDRGTTQLVGAGVRDLPLYDALDGVDTIVTFNGSSFDLPIIKRRLLVDLKGQFTHSDLMYVCRKRNLRGGLKKIEVAVGIGRATAGITGFDAPRLWDTYERTGDAAAIHTLLRYNREDVINLALLEAKLGVIVYCEPCQDVQQIFA